MSRTSNIANLQFKWLQEFIYTHFPETGIIEVGITGPSTYSIYQKLCSDILREIETEVKNTSGHNMDKGILWCWEICLGC